MATTSGDPIADLRRAGAAPPDPPGGAPHTATASLPAPRPEGGTGAGLLLVPGIDGTAAARIFRGRGGAQRRALRVFADTERLQVDQLTEHLAHARFADARAVLHGLRGACGVIGATDLHVRASRLESTLAGPDATIQGRQGDLSQQLAAFRAGLLQLIDDLHEALEQPQSPASGGAAAGASAGATSPTPGPFDASAIDLLDRLDSLLASGDFEAGQALREVDALLRNGFGNAATDQLDAMVANFDFTRALSTLRGLRRRIPAEASD
jgi:HPt (histidine-containing phosphotransfer) domain-containing protein